MRLLIVEDDARISKFLQRGLVENGFAVDTAESAECALDLVSEEVHDAFIVDLNLPGMDGLAFIDRCRELGVDAPVLILSARRSVDDRVLGLQHGGDDYMTKPFAFAELLARIHALLRRAGPQHAGTPVLTTGDLEVDVVRREVRRGGRAIELSPREFTILEYFCRNAGRVLTRTMLLDHVWHTRFDPQTNVVDVYIHRLRDKIDHPGSKPLIRTIRGVGYVLEA